MTYQLEKARADTRAIADFYRTSYLPESPPPKMPAREWQDIAGTLAVDGRTTSEEWAWGLRVTQAGLCTHCLAPLLRARDHGSPEVRMARFWEGLKALRASMAAQVARHPEYGLSELLPYYDPAFVLDAEANAPDEWKPQFNYDIWSRAAASFRDTQAEADQARVLRRMSETAATFSARERDGCYDLVKHLEHVKREDAPPSDPLGVAICGCLTKEFAERRRDDKKELLQYALDEKLACVNPVDGAARGAK